MTIILNQIKIHKSHCMFKVVLFIIYHKIVLLYFEMFLHECIIFICLEITPRCLLLIIIKLGTNSCNEFHIMMVKYVEQFTHVPLQIAKWFWFPLPLTIATLKVPIQLIWAFLSLLKKFAGFIQKLPRES